MGAKAKIPLNKIFPIDVIPERFALILKENQVLYAVKQKTNQITPPEISGYTYFGSGGRLFYYIKEVA